MNASLFRKSFRDENYPCGGRYWHLGPVREIHCESFYGSIIWEIKFRGPWVLDEELYVPRVVVTRKQAIQILEQEGIL
jgi:hypothetical protein